MAPALVDNHRPAPLELQARRLAGKVILVTGASAGIGRAAATRFAAEGAQVVAGARRRDRVDELAADIEAAGGEALAVTLDVTDEASVRAAVAAAVERFGGLHGALNNAATIGSGRPVHELEAADWRAVVDMNLTGVHLAMKHELPALLEAGGGAIVNVGSTGGMIAMPGWSDYAASKWGVHALTRSAALEYARYGVRVNALAPGSTRTEMWDALGDEHTARLEARLDDWIPLNCIALPDDAARVALFLLSDEARWITGAVLPADGGQHAAAGAGARRFERWAETETETPPTKGTQP